MKILNKDEILEASDLSKELVSVPEWGGAVYVRSMSGADRDEFENSMVVEVDGKRQPDLKNMRAKLVALTVVDEHGNRVFDAADIPALARKSAAALERVFDVAQRLNGLGGKALEEATKNSEAATSGDSGSGSPKS
jgi:hypothetical protein